MADARMPELVIQRLSDQPHHLRVYGPRPGVPNGSANDPANLFVVDTREHPLAVGAGFPEPDGLHAGRRASPFFRGLDYTAADQVRLAAAMVDQFGDASLIHEHFAWGPNFYGSGLTFAMVDPARHPWAVITYLQALTGAGAAQRPNLRCAFDSEEPVSLRLVFEELTAREGITAGVVAGIVRGAFLSSRDWIKPAVYGEPYGRKMDLYRTRITIANPTWLMVVAYLERTPKGTLAIHTHVATYWGEQPERLFDYHPADPTLLFCGAFRPKHLFHVNHDAGKPQEDSTVTRGTLYLYTGGEVERIME